MSKWALKEALWSGVHIWLICLDLRTRKKVHNGCVAQNDAKKSADWSFTVIPWVCKESRCDIQMTLEGSTMKWCWAHPVDSPWHQDEKEEGPQWLCDHRSRPWGVILAGLIRCERRAAATPKWLHQKVVFSILIWLIHIDIRVGENSGHNGCVTTEWGDAERRLTKFDRSERERTFLRNPWGPSKSVTFLKKSVALFVYQKRSRYPTPSQPLACLCA